MATVNEIGYTAAPAAAADDREARILAHLPQVRWIAARIHERLPGSTSLEDLISIGVIGLINAIDNFDSSRDVQLKTYAEYRIRGAILDSVRGLDGIPAHKRKRLKMIQNSISRLEQKLQSPPSETEIAVELGLSLAEYQQWLVELRGITIGSLDAPGGDGEGATLLQYIANAEAESPARTLERAELEKLIERAIRNMPEKERLILDLYFRQELSMKEIATIMNLHVTRISQLKTQAILRLRSFLAKFWPSPNGIYA